MIRQLLSQCLFWERTHFPSISHYSQSILRILPSDILRMFQMGKARVQKPKNTIWPPGSHFESDIAENRQASVNSHKRYAHKIWNWYSKANLNYAAKIMPPTESRDRKINMATRRPFWKWCHWKSIGSYPYTWALCYWSLELIFETKQKLESGTPNKQYGC